MTLDVCPSVSGCHDTGRTEIKNHFSPSTSLSWTSCHAGWIDQACHPVGQVFLRRIELACPPVGLLLLRAQVATMENWFRLWRACVRCPRGLKEDDHVPHDPPLPPLPRQSRSSRQQKPQVGKSMRYDARQMPAKRELRTSSSCRVPVGGGTSSGPDAACSGCSLAL